MKTKIYRSERYMKFLWEHLSCAVCFTVQGIDAHHTETGGMGIKGSDLSCIPLCRKHHQELHSIGKDTFSKKYDIEYEFFNNVCLRLYIQALESDLC